MQRSTPVRRPRVAGSLIALGVLLGVVLNVLIAYSTRPVGYEFVLGALATTGVNTVGVLLVVGGVLELAEVDSPLNSGAWMRRPNDGPGE